jgi:transcriptional regulator with XRE-family HTH domain
MTKQAAKAEQPAIGAVLATNLAFFMKEKGFTQSSLGKKAGLAQRTIGNYLNPALRQAESKTGKAPSAKLTEVEKIAVALQIEVWELLRPITPAEREFYRQIEESFDRLRKMAVQQPDPGRPRSAAAHNNRETHHGR